VVLEKEGNDVGVGDNVVHAAGSVRLRPRHSLNRHGPLACGGFPALPLQSGHGSPRLFGYTSGQCPKDALMSLSGEAGEALGLAVAKVQEVLE
jgi:hypothetical protein